MRYFVRRSQGICLFVSTAFVFSSIGHALQPDQTTEIIAVPTDVPLHIRVTRTAPLRRGAVVEGLLTEPVYVYDRIVLPKDAIVHGTVSDLVPSDHKLRIQAVLTQFIADLNAPAEIRLAAHSPTPTGTANASLLDHLNVTARLTTPLSSDIDGKGDPVTAVVTKPLFDPQHQLILSEGTELEGAVLQAKPSRSFGRNGQLRFTFRSIKRTGENAEQIHGTLT